MENREIVEAALEVLCRSYVFPDRAAAAAARVRRLAAAGRYDGLSEPKLCATLTGDLREACPDQHLRLIWAAGPAGDRSPARSTNHGVWRAERLPGNVGYLDLRRVDPAEQSAATLAAAMQVVAHTDALLLDLRHNTGGAPSGVAFVCSYLFAPEPVHLNDVVDRAGRVQQFWTYPQLPGPRYLDRPVWVLTSARTFSGAEELAYNLQQLGRATIVGEPTRGGAHPSEVFDVSGGISVRVPVARSVNPTSGTNWEGTGVRPDVAVEAARAYEVALTAALRAVGGRVDVNRALRAEAARALADLGHAE